MTFEADASRSVTSAPLLRATLVWSSAVAVLLAVIAGIVGFAVSGTDGMWSGLVGVVVATVFLGITGLSILISNRWFGDPLYVPI
ncbi:membrane protein YdbS with pleckstrin-like domain, partial [Microbacterium endophyticum]|nr:membrane protein YdbS with pleckstrin-like domain [Microbacterium endophyticum]